MTNRLWSARYTLSAIVTLGALFLAGVTCPAEAAGNHDDGAAGPAGTLMYQGAANGSATFPSSDCTFDAKKRLVAFEAPHQDKTHPEIVTPGPLLDIGLVDPGAMVMFTSDHLHTTPQNAFMRLQQKDGVSVVKKGNQWLVTITAVQLPNQDVMNQKSVTISGTLACTHLVNG